MQYHALQVYYTRLPLSGWIPQRKASMKINACVASAYRALTWCFLGGLVLASMEALGYFFTPAGENPLPFLDFFDRFATTCAVLTAVLVGLWLFLSFFMVWLGGVRTGMVLFFLILFFILYGYLVIILDLLLLHMRKYDAHWLTLMRYFASIALITSVLCSLVLGKLSRRFASVRLSLRVFFIATVVLLGFVFAVWVRYARLPEVHTALYWGAFAVAAIAGAVLLWWLGKTPLRLGILTAVLFIVVVASPSRTLIPQPSLPAMEVPGTSGARPVKRVILVIVDTLRRDALGCYNPDVGYTPKLDQFARECSLFANAYSSAPWTYPSVTSILTGLSPRVHTLTDGKSALPGNVPTLAEAMKKAGYHTAAVGFNGLLTPRSRLDRGFTEYHWFPQPSVQLRNFEVGLTHNLVKLCGDRKPDASGLTDVAIQWLKNNADRDFFLWLHYFDPHMPYMPPKEFQPQNPEVRERGDRFMETRAGRMGSTARTAEERAWISALYDGEVAYVDTQVGRVFEALKQLNLYEDTLVLFTSDHGEELWEHGRFEHGHTLYNELIHVPMLIKLPGTPAQARVEATVSTQAIAPTLLELCAAPAANPESMLPPFTALLKNPAGSAVEQPVFSGAPIFHEPLESVVFEGMKYVRGVLSGHELLFNLAEDPEERNSLADRDPASAAKGRQLLDAARAADERTSAQLDIQKTDSDLLNHEDIQSLEALGYL